MRILRVLYVEDSERDVAVVTRHLVQADFQLTVERVDTAKEMEAALQKKKWDLILCDYTMPQFNALAALTVLQESKLDIPFIIISGTIGERTAVDAMLAGAQDYLMKDNLVRLSAAVERELQEARNRLARRQMEAALVESEDRYRDLVEHSLDLICTHDLEGRILSVNQTAVKLLGYDKKILLDKNIRDLLFDEHPYEFLNYIKKLLSDGVVKGVMSVKTQAGKRLIWEYTNTLRSEGVTHPIVRGIAHDISARKLAEDALEQAEIKYKNLVESSPAIVYVCQSFPPYAPIYVSPNIAAFGYSPEEWFSNPDIWTSLIHLEDQERVIHITEDAMEQGLPIDLEYRIVARDGQIHWMHVSGGFVSDSRGERTGWQGLMLDITKTKTLEEQLRQAQKLESVGLLAGGIAHDFNNMLGVIIGYSDMTLRRMAQDDPLRRNIEEIRNAGGRSAALTHQLLAFSRRQILQPVVLDLNDVIADTIEILHRLIGEDIQLNAVLNPKVNRVKVDPGQFSQIIMNLAINARDAMPRGGKLSIETANVFLEPLYAAKHQGVLPGDYVMVTVTDTGDGIGDEDKKHIFDPFFTTKEVGKGTGLGLATVYGIVKQSGGNIEVYSEKGVGTTFKIYVPRMIDDFPELKTIDTYAAMPEGTETILLVEDEEMVRNLAKEILTTCGYKVIEAENGVEALSICETVDVKFDLLMTDVVMPQMGGRELAEKLTLKFPNLKILFTSGYTDDAVVRHGVIEANTNFMQKPYTPEAITSRVRQILGNLPVVL